MLTLAKFCIMSAMLVAFASGFVAHHCVFKHGEWHLSIRNIVFAHSVLAFAILYLQLSFSDTYKEAFLFTCILCGCYLVSLFVSISIYRVFFHPLSKFNGPRLASLSKLWHVYHARNSTNYLLMDEIHKKYGALVRTGKLFLTYFVSLQVTRIKAQTKSRSCILQESSFWMVQRTPTPKTNFMMF